MSAVNSSLNKKNEMFEIRILFFIYNVTFLSTEGTRLTLLLVVCNRGGKKLN